MATYLSSNMADAPSATLPVQAEDAVRASYFAALKEALPAGVARAVRPAPVAGSVIRVEGGKLLHPRSFGPAMGPAAVALAQATGATATVLPSGRVLADYRPTARALVGELIGAFQSTTATPAERRDRAARRAAHQQHNQEARVQADAELKARTHQGGYRTDRQPSGPNRSKGKGKGGKGR